MRDKGEGGVKRQGVETLVAVEEKKTEEQEAQQLFLGIQKGMVLLPGVKGKIGREAPLSTGGSDRRGGGEGEEDAGGAC